MCPPFCMFFFQTVLLMQVFLKPFSDFFPWCILNKSTAGEQCLLSWINFTSWLRPWGLRDDQVSITAGWLSLVTSHEFCWLSHVHPPGFSNMLVHDKSVCRTPQPCCCSVASSVLLCAKTKHRAMISSSVITGMM